MDLEHRRDMHERVGNTYQSWCLAADQSFAAARVLKTQYDTFDVDAWATSATETMPDHAIVFPTLLMLRGMGLECLLKALWLKKGNPLVANGKYAEVPNTKQHDLVGLARQVGLALSPQEMHLLARLSDSITHGGRYPIAKRGQDHLRMLKHPKGGEAASGTWCLDDDETAFADFSSRLHKELGW